MTHLWPPDAPWPGEDLLKAILASMPETTVLFDGEGRYVEVLREGYSPERRFESPLRGKTVYELWPKDIAEAIHNAIELAIGTGITVELEYPIDNQGEVRWLLARGRKMEGPGPWENHVLWMVRQITGRKQKEDRFREQKERTISFQETLLELASMDKSNYETSVEAILLAAAKALHAGRVSYWRLIENPPGLKLECLVQEGNRVASDPVILKESDFPAYFDALKTKRVIAAADALTDDRTYEFTENYLIPLGIGALMDVPVWYGGQAVGIICHEHLGGPREWPKEEQEFGYAISNLLSLALVTRERAKSDLILRQREAEIRTLFEEEQRELRRALKLQHSTFPKEGEQFGDFRLYHLFNPASLLCGDFFEVMRHGEWIAMLMGDVSGHGPSAAMVTMALRSLFPHLVEEAGPLAPDPMELLDKLDHEMNRVVPVDLHYATALAVIADIRGKLIHMACAGHPRPILLDQKGRPIPVAVGKRPPLNIGFPVTGRPYLPITMQRGQKLLLYTDGLPESFDPEGVMWGEEGFLNAVERHGRLSGMAFLQGVSDEAKAYRGWAVNKDDEAMLLLELPLLD